MPDTNPQETLDTNSSEFRLNRFESAWRDGGAPPDWRQHLPADEERRGPDYISDLLQIDIEYRIKAGLPALLTEHYFEHPRLQKEDARLDDEQQVKLIRWEYQLRWQIGQRPSRAEYEAVFPQHAEAVRQMKPQSRCPRCRKEFVLDETLQTLFCPDCDSESTLLAETASPTAFDTRVYELIETLGKGAMGEVYRCGDPALGRNLAIKVMKAKYRGQVEAERRFVREARVTGSLQHPGIVSIHNLGRLRDGRLHYTMRLVRGQTFADILKEEAGKPERLPYLLSIFEKICQAVAYAHSKRVIHRDLKPLNVMVGKFGEVQVMDWGLAKVLNPGDAVAESDEAMDAAGTRIFTESADTPVDLSRTGAAFGTLQYMPSEQARGKWNLVDERADVFALGSILCEILTGQPVYIGTSVNEICDRAERGDVAETLQRLQQCGADAALTALCCECLSLNREDRPRDAAATAKRVAEYQAEVQERVRQAELERAAAEVKAREERKRHRWVFAFILLLLATTAISTWQAVRATNAETRAHDALAQRDEKERDLRGEKLNASLYSLSRGGLSAPYREFGSNPLLVKDLWLRYLEKDLELLEAKRGPDDGATLVRREMLAHAYLFYGGHCDQAIRLFDEIIKWNLANLGSDHPDTLNSQRNLALAYRDAGRIDDALALLEKVQEKARRIGSDAAPEAIRVSFEVAYSYYKAGLFAKAEPIYRDALEKTRAVIGKDHPIMADQMAMFAKNLLRLHKYTEAETMLRSCLQMKQASQQEDWVSNNICSLLGEALLGQRNYTEAEPLLLQSYEWMKKFRPLFPPGKIRESEELSEALDRLTRYYEVTGKKDELAKVTNTKDEVEYWLKEPRPMRPGEPPPPPGPPPMQEEMIFPNRRGSMLPNRRSLFAKRLLDTFGFDHAESFLKTQFEDEAAWRLYGWTTGNARSLLGEALLEQKKYAEAERVLLQGYESLKKSEPQIILQGRIRLIEALKRLIRLYEVAGKKEIADQWRRKLDEMKELGKDSSK